MDLKKTTVSRTIAASRRERLLSGSTPATRPPRPLNIGSRTCNPGS